MSSGRALVTFARSWQALAVVRSLGAAGIEVVTGDELEITPSGLSRYAVGSFTYPNPDRDPQGFLEAVEAAVETFRPEEGVPYALLPVHRETYVLARAAERLRGAIGLAAPPAGCIERVRDKGRLVEVARRAGVETPRTWAPRDAGGLEACLDEVEPPAFVKRRTGAGGVGIERVESREELAAAFERLAAGIDDPRARPIVQQAAPGDDYCVTALFVDGRRRAMATYRNLRKLSDDGPGAVRETVAAEPAEAAAERLLEALDWHGIAQVDFLWNGEPDGTPYLIEINPRLFGGLYQVVASGVDYPLMLWRMALGEDPGEPGRAEIGLRTETPVVGLLATLREIVERAGDTERLAQAWRAAGDLLAEGSVGEAAGRLLAALREGLSAEERLEAVRSLLEERQGSVSQLFADDDPRAALGLVYPLVVFLRHGKVTSDLLMGVGDGGGSDSG